MEKVEIEKNAVFETLPNELDILTMPKAERLERATLEFLQTGDKVHLVEERYGLEYRDIENYIASNPKECNKLIAKALRKNLNKQVAIISKAQDVLLKELSLISEGKKGTSVKDLGILVSSNSKTVQALAQGLGILAQMDGVKVSDANEDEPLKLEDYIDGTINN